MDNNNVKINEELYFGTMIKAYKCLLENEEKHFSEIMSEIKEMTENQRRFYLVKNSAYMRFEFPNRGNLDDLNAVLDEKLEECVRKWKPNHMNSPNPSMSVGAYFGIYFDSTIKRYYEKINGVSSYYTSRYLELKKTGLSIWANDLTSVRKFIQETWNIKNPDRLIMEFRNQFPNTRKLPVRAEMSAYELFINVSTRLHIEQKVAEWLCYLYLTKKIELSAKDEMHKELEKFMTPKMLIKTMTVISSIDEKDAKLMFAEYYQTYRMPVINSPKEERARKRMCTDVVCSKIGLTRTFNFGNSAVTYFAKANGLTLHYAKKILLIYSNEGDFFKSHDEVCNIIKSIGFPNAESAYRKIKTKLDEEKVKQTFDEMRNLNLISA